MEKKKTLAIFLLATVTIGYMMYWCFVLPFLEMDHLNSVQQNTIGLVIVQVSAISLNAFGFLISMKFSGEVTSAYLGTMFAADLFFSCFVIPTKIAFLWNVMEKYFHILFCIAAAFMALSTTSFVATCISHITLAKTDVLAGKSNSGHHRVRKMLTLIVIVAYGIAVGVVHDFYSENENQALYTTVLQLLTPMSFLVVVAVVLPILRSLSPFEIRMDTRKLTTYIAIFITYVVFCTPQCVFMVLQRELIKERLIDGKMFLKVNHILFGMFVLKSCLSPIIFFLFNPTWRFQFLHLFSSDSGMKTKVTADPKYILYSDCGEAV